MSSQSANWPNVSVSASTSPNPKKGEIELIGRLSEQVSQLFLNQDYSDVTFIVGNGERLPGHRVILAARSDWFRALLYGGLSETTQDEVRIKAPSKAFKSLLRYIYSGNLSLSSVDEETVLDILGLANQYGFSELELKISEYLREILSINNVCAILDSAMLFGLHSLVEVCHTFMDRNATELLRHESFLSLSQESLCGLLKRDSFFAPEVQIFSSVHEWFKHNPAEQRRIKEVISLVRLPLMNLDQLLDNVRRSGILEPEQLLDAISAKTFHKNLNHRGALFPNENVAAAKLGGRVIVGEVPYALLDGDIKNYDLEKGYTRHVIGEFDEGIIVELGTIYIINHVRILLWDRDSRSYSYYVEVSVNQKTWERVVDYSAYFCRSWQFLYFAPRAVRYIRLVGTYNTVNRVFHVVQMEAKYVEDMPRLVNQLIEPVANIATLERSATVVEGVSRARNALLNGDVKNYDWDSGYTCHQLGSGCILIQLGQPYYVGSMRILLWDCDERAYSFYIETSVDQKNWDVVVDKRGEQLKSWVHLTFNPRPIVFVRIIGTFNTANEIFHCVHFECPSQDPKYLREKNKGGGSSDEATSSSAPGGAAAVSEVKDSKQ